MDALLLLLDLTRRGVKLSLRDGGTTIWASPRAALTDTDRTLLRKHKLALITLLTGDASPTRSVPARGPSHRRPISQWGDAIASFLSVGERLDFPELRYDDPNCIPGQAQQKVEAGRPGWRAFADRCLYQERWHCLEAAHAAAVARLQQRERPPAMTWHERRHASERQRVFSAPKHRGLRQWATAYYDPATGQGVTDDGARFSTRLAASLDDLLARVPDRVERIFLCGLVPDGLEPDDPGTRIEHFLAWAQVGATSPWAENSEHPHWIDEKDPTACCLRFEQRESGRRLEIRHMACWFGDKPASPDDARAALAVLRDRLGDSFHESVMRGTPAQYGLDLWRSSLLLNGRGAPADAYPPLPDDIQRLIAGTSGQGRSEVFTSLSLGAVVPANATLYDGRLMYVASMGKLGVGPVQHDTQLEYVCYHPARYRVIATVPPDWQHVGILPAPIPQSSSEMRWSWPSRPGDRLETWVGDLEIVAALWPYPGWCPTCAAGRSGKRSMLDPATGARVCNPMTARCPIHGWPLQIVERLLFAPTTTGPLDLWRDRLLRVREEIAADGRLPEHVRHLAVAATRSILLNTLGSFNRSDEQKRVTRSCIGGDGVPDGAINPQQVLLPDGRWLYRWNERAPTGEHDSGYLAETRHPEWCAQVYSHTRARLLIRPGLDRQPTGLLAVPPEHCVGCRTDAVLLACDPGWHDDGQIGRLRPKAHLHSAVPWPHGLADYDRLIKQKMRPVEVVPECCRLVPLEGEAH